SSRGRHTRFSRDWSSDVCSSDLEDLGITCALILTDTEGVVLGRRHDPLGVPFWNCPTEGHDVVVKLEDAVIGGAAGVGKGWRMQIGRASCRERGEDQGHTG